MKDQISQSDIMEAIQRAVLKYGQKRMAGEIDMQVSTLSNKTSPYDGPERRHYLTLWEADDITTKTGDVKWLELEAARHGYMLIPMNVTPDAPTFAAEALQDEIARGEYLKEQDPVKQVHLLHDLIRETMETHALRQRENGIGPVGFIIGHVRVPGGFQ